MATRPQKTSDAAKSGDRLSIRIDLASGAQIGPGKIAVLEEIARAGSISAAGRALRMSYRRTWELVEDLNNSLGTPVVETAAGGSGGGGGGLERGRPPGPAARRPHHSRALPRHRGRHRARRPQTPAGGEPRLLQAIASPTT